MRHLFLAVLPTLFALSNLFMCWKFCSVITNSKFPVVVVISESMAPAFHRGDLLFLWNRSPSVEVGDVPLVWFAEQSLPILHRAVKSHWTHDAWTQEAVQHILTKGDNNDADDVTLYPAGRRTVLRHEVKGVVRGYMPYLGWGVIALKDFLQRV